MKDQRRIGIVYPYANLDSVPSLVSTAVLLAKHGYLVDILTHFDSMMFVRPSFENGRVAVLRDGVSPPGQWPVRAGLVLGRVAVSARLVLGRLMGSLYRLTVPGRLMARHRKAPYACLIGVDPAGLVRAHSLRRWLKVPLAYYSLELLLSHEMRRARDRRLKARELALSQEAAFVIIQDDERAALLMRDNHVHPERIITVPNAPLGPAGVRRTDYLRRKFNLDPDIKIILQSGSMDEWAGTHHLIQSVHDWPHDWVLVCHTRSRSGMLFYDRTVGFEHLIKTGRVLLSTEPIPRREYPDLVASADVGIAFYCTQPGNIYAQDNIYHIGLSSGKLAYYLQSGLPVIVNDIPSLRRLVTTYRCGELVDVPAVTAHAIRRILADYDAYSRQAATCFNQEFDFAGRFEKVLARLDHLIGKG